MNSPDPTTNAEAPPVTLLSILELYEQRFSQEGVAMRLRVKTNVITRMLGRYGLKQADVLRRIRAGESAAQINATAAPITKATPSELASSVGLFITAFEAATAGSSLPVDLSTAFARLKASAIRAGAVQVPQPGASDAPAFIQREVAAQSSQGVEGAQQATQGTNQA